MSAFYRGNGVYGDKPKNYVKHLHRLSKTAAHRSWIAMMQRCYNKNADNYPRYGGIGVTVCERWHQFVYFYTDMGDRPKQRSLERIDTERGYSKENCRWATATEQQRNKRNNRFVTIKGERRTLAEWAEVSGIRYITLYNRLTRGRHPVDRLLERVC